MKKLLFTIAIAGMFGACKNKTSSSEKNMVPLADPSGYNSAMSDTSKSINTPVSKDSQVTTTTVTVTKTPVSPNSKTKTTSSTKTNTGINHPSNNAGTTSVPASTNSTATASQPQKKKGWSKAAKGTAIGAGAGAVTGAIIGKNVKGAVIGGVVGAAGGYIIGRSQDKKDGRVRKDSF